MLMGMKGQRQRSNCQGQHMSEDVSSCDLAISQDGTIEIGYTHTIRPNT
jgi:hypothetical protein